MYSIPHKTFSAILCVFDDLYRHLQLIRFFFRNQLAETKSKPSKAYTGAAKHHLLRYLARSTDFSITHKQGGFKLSSGPTSLKVAVLCSWSAEEENTKVVREQTQPTCTSKYHTACSNAIEGTRVLCTGRVRSKTPTKALIFIASRRGARMTHDPICNKNNPYFYTLASTHFYRYCILFNSILVRGDSLRWVKETKCC